MTKTQLLIVSSLILIITACSDRQTSTPPNIIMFVADDLSWADYETSSEGFLELPFLSKLANNGMVYDRFYPGAANCSPSRSCILTGMSTVKTSIYTPGAKSKGPHKKMYYQTPTRDNPKSGNIEVKSELHDSMICLPEVLKMGHPAYKTLHLGKWHLGKSRQGYDEFILSGRTERTETTAYADTTIATNLTRECKRFITEHQESPFFVSYNFWEPHVPLAAPSVDIRYYEDKKKGNEKFSNHNAMYAAETRVIDRNMATIYNHLDSLELLDNTIVIFLSDNGGYSGNTINAPLKGAKGSFYEGGIRTPLIVKWDKRNQKSGKEYRPVLGIDLKSTFSELVDVACKDCEGQSLLAINKERNMYMHYPLYLKGEYYNKLLPVKDSEELLWRAVPSSVIMNGDWKLIYYHEYKSSELFNLRDDISESKDLSHIHKDIKNRLEADLFDWLDKSKAPIPDIVNPSFINI